MNNNCTKESRAGRAARRIGHGLLAAVAMLTISTIASAQNRSEEFAVNQVQTPTTPALITPPAGNSPFLEGHGVGTQGYVCLPDSSGRASWTVNGARPEATLFANIFGEAIQIITHFLSPVENPNGVGPNPPRFGDVTWQSSFDSSRVWAQKQHFITAGTDQSCPNGGAIDCLLLQVIGSAQGPAGGQSLTKTTFIQRLNTKGGSAPATGCAVLSEVGRQTLVPYSADYIFFRAEQ